MANTDISKDQERLAKLWDAYETQEKELELTMKNIANLENKIQEMERVNKVLKRTVEDRDKEIRDLELKLISLEEDNSKYMPRINELEQLYKEEKERYSKLFAVTEELEDDLAKAREEIKVKDKWFEKNVGMLENIRDSIVERNIQLKDLDTKPAPAELPMREGGPAPEDSVDVLKKDYEKITFKTVEIEKPEKTESESKPAFGTLENQGKTKNEIIYEFTKIQDVDTGIAEKLYDGGFTGLEKLKQATTEDIAKLEGITPTVARKIRTSLQDM
jgi:chromosome segregation ATPase